jgi:hypothetical protein
MIAWNTYFVCLGPEFLCLKVMGRQGGKDLCGLRRSGDGNSAKRWEKNQAYFLWPELVILLRYLQYFGPFPFK